MNEKTYNALKRIIAYIKDMRLAYEGQEKDKEAIEQWIDEVAKEYEPLENRCPKCGGWVDIYGHCINCPIEKN
jgi:hypothetical protein